MNVDKPMLITLSDAHQMAERDAKRAYTYGLWAGILCGTLLGVMLACLAVKLSRFM